MSVDASGPGEAKWDVFISYASEDKDTIAIPLAELLRNEGLRVWFDRFELRAGDSISQSIEIGLANSQVGVVILSQTSLRKNWTKYEIAALKQLYINFARRIVPVWKDIGPSEIKETDPGLLDFRALSTKEFSTEEIAYEIISVANPALLAQINAKSTWKTLHDSARVATIPLKDLRRSPRRRQKLSAESLSRIRILHSVFFEVLEDELESWIDNFCRDLNYEEEILQWERMAALFLDWTSSVGNSSISGSERRAMYEVVFMIASCFPAEQIELAIKKLPRKHARCLSKVMMMWEQEVALIQSYSTDELVNHPTITRKFDRLRGEQKRGRSTKRASRSETGL